MRGRWGLPGLKRWVTNFQKTWTRRDLRPQKPSDYRHTKGWWQYRKDPGGHYLVGNTKWGPKFLQEGFELRRLVEDFILDRLNTFSTEQSSVKLVRSCLYALREDRDSSAGIRNLWFGYRQLKRARLAVGKLSLRV